MPCKDVTELLEVVLDGEDRLKAYKFQKRTCGQGVGAESLLIDQLEGRSLEELLNKTAEDFLTEFPIFDEIEEFLSLKHLFAVQGALEVLTGREPGGKNAAFAASEISYGEDETRIQGRIAVDVITEKIEACGGCASCGSEKTKAGKAKNAGRRAARVEAAADSPA